MLTPNDPPAVSLPPGDGPRHFHFHPNGRWFYSIQEEGSTIVLFDYDAASRTAGPRQTISTLPPGFAGSNFCSEILVSADGRFVYAGNRLHDSIGIFSVGRTANLTFVGEEWTRGNYPRSFNFDPTGQFLYCCNQRADNVTVFRVDRETGGLTFTGHYTPVGNPSSIVFLDLARGADRSPGRPGSACWRERVSSLPRSRRRQETVRHRSVEESQAEPWRAALLYRDAAHLGPASEVAPYLLHGQDRSPADLETADRDDRRSRVEVLGDGLLLLRDASRGVGRVELETKRGVRRRAGRRATLRERVTLRRIDLACLGRVPAQEHHADPGLRPPTDGCSGPGHRPCRSPR